MSVAELAILRADVAALRRMPRVAADGLTQIVCDLVDTLATQRDRIAKLEDTIAAMGDDQ